MKRLKLFSLFLLLLIGVGQVWATDQTITINYNGSFSPALPSASGSVNTTSTAHTIEGLAIMEQGIYKGSSNNYLMFVQNKGFLYNTESLGTIKSVSVTYTSGTSDQGKAYTYFGSTVQSTYTTSSNATINKTNGNTWSNSTTGNGFFQLSTSNKNVQITQIVITYEATSGGGGQGSGGNEEAGTGTINFGSASGSLNVNAASVSGDDSRDKTWTVTTVGTTSFTPSSTYAQVGSSSKPATSITFTTTLDAEMTVTAFSAKFGGFSGTEGTVKLKVGDTEVGSGSLNASSDVTVTASNTTTSGTVLTVTVTGISKGVKAYFISYTVAASGGDDPGSEEPTVFLNHRERPSNSLIYNSAHM